MKKETRKVFDDLGKVIRMEGEADIMEKASAEFQQALPHIVAASNTLAALAWLRWDKKHPIMGWQLKASRFIQNVEAAHMHVSSPFQPHTRNLIP